MISEHYQIYKSQTAQIATCTYS